MNKQIHQHPAYMAHMHIQELTLLKRLSIIDGEICLNTGALNQAVTGRIAMYEGMIDRSPDTYAEELAKQKEEDKRQADYLRGVR